MHLHHPLPMMMNHATPDSASPRKLILVLNCGSSSIKFAVFDADSLAHTRQALTHGRVQGIGGPGPQLHEAGQGLRDVTLDADHPYGSALHIIRARLASRLAGSRLLAAVHRIVHGGSRHFAPVRLDAKVLAELHTLVPLAPLHQPFALESAEILLRENPDLPQIACFDTAFHHSQPAVEQMLPLPRAFWQRGLRRYGFHGLSYEYMAAALPQRHGARAQARVIVAHLGSGASLCALHGLQSVASTMGFSALDGLMMGTRTGSIDPGALLYLLEIEDLSLQQLGHMLYHESGLLGVSGISAEIPALLALEAGSGANAQAARDALALYVRRIVREIGALTAVLGGLDLLVFTAGVGENSAEIRQRICAHLDFLGLRLDPQANAAHAGVISRPDSAVVAGVEATNEEWIAARHAARCLGPVVQ